MNFALIFAGGVGSRMGSTIPKQFLEIDSKSIISYVIDKFEKSDLIDKIVVVTLDEYIEKMKSIINDNGYKKVANVLKGGDTAFQSQYNGIEYLSSISNSNDDLAVVHDGVRPFIDESLIEKCIKVAKEKGNSVVVSPSAETIAIKDGDRIVSTMPRQNCLIARAPQTFYLKDLVNAHKKAKQEGKEYIDSASMFLEQGKTLNPIVGPDKNIKITTQYDYSIAKLLLKDDK